MNITTDGLRLYLPRKLCQGADNARIELNRYNFAIGSIHPIATVRELKKSENA